MLKKKLQDYNLEIPKAVKIILASTGFLMFFIYYTKIKYFPSLDLMSATTLLFLSALFTFAVSIILSALPLSAGILWLDIFRSTFGYKKYSTKPLAAFTWFLIPNTMVITCFIAKVGFDKYVQDFYFYIPVLILLSYPIIIYSYFSNRKGFFNFLSGFVYSNALSSLLLVVSISSILSIIKFDLTPSVFNYFLTFLYAITPLIFTYAVIVKPRNIKSSTYNFVIAALYLLIIYINGYGIITISDNMMKLYKLGNFTVNSLTVDKTTCESLNIKPVVYKENLCFLSNVEIKSRLGTEHYILYNGAPFFIPSSSVKSYSLKNENVSSKK